MAELARTIVRTEPTAIATILGGLATIATIFGLDLDVDQALGVALSIQAVVGLVVRASVYSPETHAEETDRAFEYGTAAGFRTALKDRRLQP